MRLPLACLAAALFSADTAASAASEGVAASVPTAASAPAAARPASAPRRGPEDPMDFLRERLAAKLGARQPLDPAMPGVIRVVNRGASASLAAPAAAASALPASAAASRAKGAAGAAARSAVWDYEGPGGPARWGELKPEFATCARGTRQSPIDIRDGIAVQLDPVQFDYHASGFRVVDNGHTVQVDVAPGNAIEVLGRRYELLQLHFHRPSEERIEGRQFDMVAHLMHRSADGRLAVVAVLLESGGSHPVVQTVWNNLPLDRGEEAFARANIDLTGLLPAERGYFTYMGSLTEPPCTEGVLWMVMRQPVQVSPQQIAIFARLYPMNARPIQQASGRLIKQSE